MRPTRRVDIHLPATHSYVSACKLIKSALLNFIQRNTYIDVRLLRIFLNGINTTECFLVSEQTHLRACQTSHFPVSPRPSRRVLSVTNMASNNQPPQKQDTQPGKEHVMNPIPQFTSPDYTPSNKLRVWQLWLIHIFLISIIHDI